jgi:putative glutamine amidotransferase
MKPVIGITSDYQLNEKNYFLAEAYVQAINSCAGIPLILPDIEADVSGSVMARLDGLVISGGDFDLDPELYGESRHARLGELRPRRTAYELRLLRVALERNLPLLGICGGLQLLNVALGGSLYQHLPAQIESQIGHEQAGKEQASAHSITIEPQSMLYSILKLPEIMVNSTHHQAIKQPGRGLRAVAWAPDGVIEAVESPAHNFVLGVQWHPESLIAKQPIWKGLFGRLVQEAGCK